MSVYTNFDLIKMAYNSPYNTRIMEDLYKSLKLYVGKKIDRLLELASPKTYMQYVDALTLCYLRTLPVRGESLRMDYNLLKNMQSFCDGDFESGLLFDGKVNMLQCSNGVLYEYMYRYFWVGKELTQDTFKPVAVYGLKRDDTVYYTHERSFHPIEVAINSHLHGGIYDAWLKDYCVSQKLDCSTIETARFTCIGQHAFWSTANNSPDYDVSGNLVMINGRVHDLVIEKIRIQGINYLKRMRDTLYYIRLRYDSQTGLDAILDTENNLVCIPKVSLITRTDTSDEKTLRRRFVLA